MGSSIIIDISTGSLHLNKQPIRATYISLFYAQHNVL